MKRRDVLLAMGGLGASGAFVTGTSAFTSVSADRDVAVAVADDANAFLRLAPCPGSDNGAYVDNSDGLLTIDLSGSNSNDPPAGSGVNSEALSVFDNVFEIANQGTQDVCVDFEVEVPQIPDGADVPDRYDFGPGDPAVVFYRGSSRDEFVINNVLNPDRDGAIQLPIQNGNAECIGFEVRAFGFGSGTDLFDGVDMTIRADANANCQVNGTDAVDPVPTGPTDGLIGYWPLDTIEDGTADDISGNGNDGTAEPQSNGPTPTTGQVDDAADFDGSDDRINGPQINSVVGGTMAAWINIDDLSDKRPILSINNNDDNQETLLVQPSGELNANVENGGTNNVPNSSGVNLPTDTWKHVAWTFPQGSAQKLYVDGSEVSSYSRQDDGPSSLSWSTGTVYIGYFPGDTTRRMDGTIDDVRLYDRALSQGEVQDLFDATK